MTGKEEHKGIIAGHANMDLDCLGAMVLASLLFPRCSLVKGRLANPPAREALTIFQNDLNFLSMKEIKGREFETMVVVDTRSKGRIREVWEALAAPPEKILIYDHHQNDQADIPGAQLIHGSYGAESTHLTLLCREAGIPIPQAAATLALAGIYADTGNFTHENVTPGDFEAAGWLIKSGVSKKIIQRLLRPLRGEGQLNLFHQLVAAITWRRFHGHEVALARLEVPSQSPGMAEVVERVFAAEPVDALFAVITIQDRGHRLVIARSRKEALHLPRILETLGGRGHPQAASAFIKEERNVWAELLQNLETVPQKAMTAEDLMTREVASLDTAMTVLQASLFLEEIGHTGAPVLNEKGELEGIMTLRDISKARKAQAMKAPVTAYMTHRVTACSPGDTIREVERKMLGKDLGHLPVLEGTRLRGLITRGDYKRFYS